MLNRIQKSILSSGNHCLFSSFAAPDAGPPSENDISRLTSFLQQYGHDTIVVTGAGVSTESGIPDYRSPKGAYSLGHKPVTFQEFKASELTQKRYWARNYVGYQSFKAAGPNQTHYSLAKLQSSSQIGPILTQNVDGLHQRAGSAHSHVVELHGSGHEVACYSCSTVYSRSDFQSKLRELNPEWCSQAEEAARISMEQQRSIRQNIVHKMSREIEAHSPKEEEAAMRPDGDANIVLVGYESLKLPHCPNCGAHTVKPGVVMFGENVPKQTVDLSFNHTDKARAMLIIGTSMQVFSAFRFARRASERKIPIAIVNIGPTRADDLASLTISAKSGELFSLVTERLQSQ